LLLPFGRGGLLALKLLKALGLSAQLGRRVLNAVSRFIEPALLLVQLGPPMLHVLELLLQLRLRLGLPRPLLGQLLLVAPQVVARLLQPRPQRRERRLLPFERGDALGKLPGNGVLLGLLLGQPVGLAAQLDVPLVQLPGLLLVVAGLVLQALGPLLGVFQPLLQALLALLQRRPRPVEADQIFLILSLPSRKRLLFAFELPFAGLPFLAPALEHLPLLIEPLPLHFQFRGAGVKQGVARRLFGLTGGELLGLGVDGLFALLYLAGGHGHRLAHGGQAVAALAVALLKLVALPGQVFRQRFQSGFTLVQIRSNGRARRRGRR
jgi:hypothetical protein